jgi:hypothetical protein
MMIDKRKSSSLKTLVFVRYTYIFFFVTIFSVVDAVALKIPEVYRKQGPEVTFGEVFPLVEIVSVIPLVIPATIFNN